MGYSPLVTYKNLTSKKSNRRSKIDTIIPHCYVGQVTAKEGCDYLASTDREVSANYVVGKDGSIGLNVDEDYRAWTSGGTDKYGNPIRVNGISGADWDHRAVTIEVASDTKPPYAVTDKAYKALIELIADICKRNNIKELKWEGNKSLVGKIDKQNMAVHRWFAPTECPGDYMYSKMGDIAKKVNDIIVEKPVAPVTPATKPQNVVYRIQVGAFSKEPYAKDFLAKVKKAGFKDAFIVKEGNLYKIQVGAFSSELNANNFLKTVQKAGFDAFVKKVILDSTPIKSVTQIAKEVLNGVWGNGEARKSALKKAGYDYDAVQREVNKLLDG